MFQKHVVLGIAVIYVAASCSVSRAVLASRPLSTLMAASEVIARGRIVAAELTDDGGMATVEIEEVLKGKPDSTKTRIRWSKDPEDERLVNVGSEHLLFLKRRSGEEYGPAQYGRSYLELYRDLDTRDYVVLLSGRAALIEMDLPISVTKTRVMVEVLPPGSKWVVVQCVAMKELVRLIRAEGRSAR